MLHDSSLDVLSASVGCWSGATRFRAAPEHVERYAAATNERDARYGRDFAPPVYAVLPVQEHLERILRRIPHEHAARTVHAAHDIRYRRLVRPGELVRTVAAPVGLHQRRSGAILTLAARTTSETGLPIVEQFITLAIRGAAVSEDRGERARGHRLAESVASRRPTTSVTEPVDPDQSYRYADASGDHMAIHVDSDAARAVGLPGIVLHGLCTLAFVTRAVTRSAAAGDPTRLRRVAARFARPVMPGTMLTTSLWLDDAPPGGLRVAFAATTDDQPSVPALTDGYAELAPADASPGQAAASS